MFVKENPSRKKKKKKKDYEVQANLCKALRLILKVLHPGNNKQRVPLALSIIHKTATAAIE